MARKELIGLVATAALAASCGSKNEEIDGRTLVNCTYGPKENSIQLQLKKDDTVYINRDRLTSLGNGSVAIDLGRTILFEGDKVPSKAPDGTNAYFLGDATGVEVDFNELTIPEGNHRIIYKPKKDRY